MGDQGYIVAGLSDDDMIWLLSRGQLRSLRAGERLVDVGRPIDHLYFVTRGAMAVSRGDGTRVASLGEGDVIGEMSFVDRRPPSVSVRAEQATELMAVPVQLIAARFESEPAFAARFYRALAVFLSDRLRETTAVARPDDADAAGGAAGAGDRLRRLVGMFGIGR